jgi:hypothetical protein
MGWGPVMWFYGLSLFKRIRAVQEATFSPVAMHIEYLEVDWGSVNITA